MSFWGMWGLHEAGANGDTPPMKMEPFDTLWSNGIMARHAQDGRPLGHLHWHPHGEIDSVTVHPDFQRRGVASAMLKHAQDHPDVYEASYPIRHSTNFSAAGRAWAQSDPEYHDPGDAHVTKADDDPSNWGWTAVKQYVPAHVPYTGQNEEEMAPHLQTTADLAARRQLKRAGMIDGTWPKRWKGQHPGIPWDHRWSPNHPEHVPGPWEKRTARVEVPYIRNNGGVRKWSDPDDYNQKIEPWGRYMSDGQYSNGQLQPGWERGTVGFENPMYLPHNDGNWKHELSQNHGGLTGQQLSQALLAKGHDGVITHDKYGIGEIVDIRPKRERGHKVTWAAVMPIDGQSSPKGDQLRSGDSSSSGHIAMAEFPQHGHQIPDAPGPHPDDFWGGGGCAHMALAFKSMWPDLKIGADIDNKDGTVNHAWVHDGKRAHDFMGTHDSPDGPAGGWQNATTHMDMDPAHLASIFGRDGIKWSPDNPWEDGTVHEAAGQIEQHWLGQKPYDPDDDDDY